MENKSSMRFSAKYTLTAIFRDNNGKCWKSTIGKDYDSVQSAVFVIENLIERYRGSASEIIDYTITRPAC